MSAETSPAPVARPRPRPTPTAVINDSVNGKPVPAGRVRNVTSPSPRERVLGTIGGVEVTPSTLTGVPGLARIAASTVARVTGWAVKGTATTATEMLREIGSGEPIVDIIDNRVENARHGALRFLGLENGTDHRVSASPSGRGSSYRDLRARGDSLIRASAFPEAQPRNEHPAFARILDELVPDEARIIRFMALSGPQPSIDVRTKTPFGVGSERIAGGINLIAEMAGCTYPERSQQYLANLNRLGLIRFSEEQVDDPRRYSFVEAQPVTATAIAKVKKAKTVYRSIYISLFGKQFADVCFTLDGYDAGGWLKDVR